MANITYKTHFTFIAAQMKDFHNSSHYHGLVTGLLFSSFYIILLLLCNNYYPVLVQVAGMIAKPRLLVGEKNKMQCHFHATTLTLS